MYKIVPLQQLSGVGGILLHGSFDCLHLGHLRYFKWGRELLRHGPLIVTLTGDFYFNKDKGVNRPAFTEKIRAEWISYIGVVDYVAIVYSKTGVPAIDTIKPAIYGKGLDKQGIIQEEEEACSRNGTIVHYMPTGHIYSSSQILSGEYLASRKRSAS